MQATPQQALESRIAQLSDHLATIRLQMEALLADNQRMREVVRIAEHELRKRRDQVQMLEHENSNLQQNKIEAKARVEQVMEHLDALAIRTKETSS